MVSQEVDSCVTTGNPSPLESQLSPLPHPVTANHVAMTVNGHDGSPAVNGEHPSVNGDANGEMEVRHAAFIKSYLSFFDVFL